MAFALQLPQYARNSDYSSQEYYQELLNATLLLWFNNTGFLQPTLTTAQATALFAAGLIPGRHWYNSDLDKMQFAGAVAIQTITSV